MSGGESARESRGHCLNLWRDGEAGRQTEGREQHCSLHLASPHPARPSLGVGGRGDRSHMRRGGEKHEWATGKKGSESSARWVADRALVRDLHQGQVARLAGAGAEGWPGTGGDPRGGRALSPRQSLEGADKEGPAAQASTGAPRRKEHHRARSSSPGASEGNTSPGEPGPPHRQSPVGEQTQPLCARVHEEQGITAQAPRACRQAPSSLGNGVTEGPRGVKNTGMRMRPGAGGSTGLRPRRAARTQFR